MRLDNFLWVNKTHVVLGGFMTMALILTPVAILAVSRRLDRPVYVIAVVLWALSTAIAVVVSFKDIKEGKPVSSLWSRPLFPMPLWLRVVLALVAIVWIVKILHLV